MKNMISIRSLVWEVNFNNGGGRKLFNFQGVLVAPVMLEITTFQL